MDDLNSRGPTELWPRRVRARRLPLLAGLCCAVVSAVQAQACLAAAPSRTVGRMRMVLCHNDPITYCGRASVPLDRSRADSPDIGLAFRWYPAREPPPAGAAGTLVPVEGGPGYGSVESVAEGYAPMYGPLLRSWNMLVLDNRGTGSSTPIDCPRLQTYRRPTDTSAYQQLLASCARRLDHRWRYRAGSFVQGSAMFTTAAAADDLASIIEALGSGPVALYGDSYGSWFSQIFSSRHPALVRSLVLDSTYPTVAIDPWYRSTIEAMRRDFNLVCERWPSCRQAARGNAWERVSAVAGLLQSGPVTARVPGPDGLPRRFQMDIEGYIRLLSNATFDLYLYGALDAADRALLDDGDPGPLVRLYAQQFAYDEPYPPTEKAQQFSLGLFYEVSCLDYPQLFDMAAPTALREAQLGEAEAALDPASFSPFSTTQWVDQSQIIEAYTACLRWPAPLRADPPLEHGPPLLPANLPVLVLGGELDTITPPGDHPRVIAALGGRARFIEVANATHVVGEADTPCGDQLVREFVADPQGLDSLDESCAARNPPVHAVGLYASSPDAEMPLTAAAGNRAGTAQLRLAAVAVQTAGDAVMRLASIHGRSDAGLHGGVAVGHAGTIRLEGDELVAGVPVSGTVTLVPAQDPLDGSVATAALTAGTVKLTASWTTAGAGATATVRGTAGGVTLAGTAPAP